MRNITARLDQIADQIERVNPELALRIDRISDHLERQAGLKLPSKAEAVETLRRTFKDKPKAFVKIFNKIVDIAGRSKEKTAGGLWDTLKALASPKVILSILALLVSVPKAQDIMVEIFSEPPDTAIGHQQMNKSKIKEITDKKSLSPKALKGVISGKTQWIVDDALKHWSTVDGTWDFSDWPFRYSSAKTAVGADFSSSRVKAKMGAYDNAYNSLAAVDTDYDTFEKEEDGVWVAICVAGMSDDLWNAIREMSRDYDQKRMKRLIEEAQAAEKKAS